MATVTIQATRESGIGVLWRLAMSPALDASLALAYLRELSPAVTGAALLDQDARLLAGDPAIATTADVDRADVIVVQDGDHRLLVSATPDAPRALVEFDARAALAAVRGRC